MPVVVDVVAFRVLIVAIPVTVIAGKVAPPEPPRT